MRDQESASSLSSPEILTSVVQKPHFLNTSCVTKDFFLSKEDSFLPFPLHCLVCHSYQHSTWIFLFMLRGSINPVLSFQETWFRLKMGWRSGKITVSAVLQRMNPRGQHCSTFFRVWAERGVGWGVGWKFGLLWCWFGVIYVLICFSSSVTLFDLDRQWHNENQVACNRGWRSSLTVSFGDRFCIGFQAWTRMRMNDNRAGRAW